jgi:SAM-dependent methyltransferase
VIPPESQRIRTYYESKESSWTGWPAAREYATRERRRMLLRLVGALPAIESIRICDIGCGGGGDLAFWSWLGVPQSNLAGTELIPDRARVASELLPGADIRQVDGFELPFSSGRFDLTTASLVFSSVLDAQSRRQLFAEMQRVTAVGGLTVVYDMRITKPSNRAISRFTPASVGAAVRAGARYKATPFLPALALVLPVPRFVRGPLIALLPRTHAIWVWPIKPGNR